MVHITAHIIHITLTFQPRMSLEKKIIQFLKGPKKGETYELKSGLVSQYKHERKDAIQRVIQAMTIGKDVSALFPDVLKNIATYDLEQKKLVYLYLMNYAKSNPELCILAVNTFVQDTEDPNPLVRALAIRTMGCIRVARMVDYMEIPLRRTLEDDNPYVRKTAAICVAKLFDLNAEMCIELGFFDALKKLLQDPNPMVVANALNALHEIKDMNQDQNLSVLEVDAELVKLLLACLNECSEWGRITILSYLAEYLSPNPDDTLHLIERVIPQLQHVNPSVVLSSIKVVIHHLDGLSNQAQKTSFLRKLSAPMVSLVSLPIPEAQYVGLKNIRIILEKYPSCLSKELRVFFIKYSDPLYLKLEKLDILVRLATDSNSALLLSELKEYAMEFEPTLITKAVNSIGAVAIKLSDSVFPAVNLLVTLMELRGGEFIINESAVVLTQILRRYPGRNDLITLVVPVLSHHVDELNSTAALSGYVFLLGEYPKYFTNIKEKLQLLTDEFLAHDAVLQLSIITAVVKASSQKNGFSHMLQTVLEKATKECDNADVRDKAFLYWRFLSIVAPAEQNKFFTAQLPPIETIIPTFNPAVLDELIDELSTLSSVYHKPASTFISTEVHKSKDSKTRRLSNKADISDLANIAKQEILNNAKNENLLDFDDDEPVLLTNSGTSSALDELDDLFSIPTTPQTKPGNSKQDIMDLFGSSSQKPATAQSKSSTSNINSDLLDLI